MRFISAISLLSPVALATVQWTPCTPVPNSKVPLECATLPVPLDYTIPDGPSLLLNLTRTVAIHQPAKGSILFNFGGPGAIPAPNFATLGKYYLNITGGAFDLVGIDPRGTGETLKYSCYATAAERALATAVSPGQLANSSDVAPGRLWAEGELKGQACTANTKENSTLVGSAFVARDFMSVVDALEEDKMLRYFGVSYGTALGATIAAMFPDRIDRMILDGVLNPHQYYNGYDSEQFAAADETFSAFFCACVESPDLCALARPNTTAEQLEQNVLASLEKLKYNPALVNGTIVDYTAVKGIMHSTLYTPSYYTHLSLMLDALVKNNMTAVADLALASIPDSEVLSGDANMGIRCGDKIARTKTLAEFQPTIDDFLNTSPIFGEVSVGLMSACAQWPVHAKEAYSGDFNVKTKNPVMLIGNTHDPTTPLASARNVSAGFEGSVVLQQDGFGHVSYSQISECTYDTVRTYFVNGTLPAPGTICPVDTPTFTPDLL